MQHIGIAIRFIRQSMDLDQKQLSALSGISSSHICAIELGKRDPSWGTIQKICDSLGLDLTMVTILMEGKRPEIKPLLPIVYNKLWEKSQAHGETTTTVTG